MKENKFVKFVKEHKKEALVLTAVTTAGVVAWVITKDKSSNYSELTLPELTSGKFVNLWKSDKGRYAGGVAGTVQAIDVADLGKFGEALTTIDGIDEHEPIRIIFGTERSYI